MNTLLEQRADELAASRRQQALAAFEAEYQELLAPISGSKLTYRVIPAKMTGLALVFESASAGETIQFDLLDTGHLSASWLGLAAKLRSPQRPPVIDLVNQENLTFTDICTRTGLLTPSHLTEILAEHVVNGRKRQELREWEQKLKPFRLLGQTWPYLSALALGVAVLSGCLALEYWYRQQPVPIGKLCLCLAAFLVPALVAFVTDWCYKFNRRFLAEAISLQLVQTVNF